MLTVTDPSGNAGSAEIKLTEKAISYGTLVLQVDQEINLLEWITLGKGVDMEKVEIEIDGETTEITDPAHFVPSYPGTCNIIITVRKNGTMIQEKVDNLTIKPLDYKAIEITNIKPEEILPII